MSILSRAYVSVKPDTSEFEPELERQLRHVDATKAGGRAGKTFGVGFTTRMNQHLRALDLPAIDIKADPKHALAEIAKTEAQLRILSREGDIELHLKSEHTLGELARLKKDLTKFTGDGITEGAQSGFLAALKGFGPISLSNPYIAVGLAGAIAAGAPIIGAAAGAAITAGIGGGVLAAGIALAAKDERVKQAWAGVAKGAGDQLTSAAGVFVGPLVRASGTFGSAFASVMPGIRADFKALVPSVDRLAEGAAGFIRNAAGGADKLIQSARPFLDVLARELPNIGNATSDFFRSVAAGGPGALLFWQDFLSGTEKTVVGLGNVIEGLSKTYDFLGGSKSIGARINDSVNNEIVPALDRWAHWVDDNIGGRLNKQFDEAWNIDRDGGKKKQADNLKGALAEIKPSADEVARGSLDAQAALTQFAAGMSSAATTSNAYSQILAGIGHTAAATGPTMDTLGTVFNNVASAELSATDRANLLKQAWQQMYGPAINQTDATEAFNLSLFTLKDRLDKGSGSLDINNAAGIRNRDTVQDLIKKNTDLYFANIASGMSAEDAARQHDENAVKIEKAGQKAGLTRGDVEKLNAEYGRIPPGKVTEVTMTGAAKVFQQLLDLKAAQLALSQGIDINDARKQVHNQTGQGGGGLREGGPVFGPGTGTSDSITARLSAGEHVWTAKEVKAAGGHAAVEVLRKVVLRGRSPRARRPGDGSEGIAFADGGPVWPFPVNVSKTMIPQVPSVQAGLDAQAFVRAQAGKPYIWASAGPAGYDCSGIVSAAWNLLHGQYPYSHTFSTMNQAGYFPLGGAGGVLTAGWSNAGERGGGSVGHTAARLGGLAFESRGGDGVVVGSGVTPLSSFAHIGHFADGGMVPGPYGRPQPAIVHGGEYVASGDDMTTLIGEVRTLIATVERVAPELGRELRGASRSTLQAARAKGGS